MSLNLLIELAGGITNILRILAPEGRVTVAVRDLQQVKPLPTSIVSESVLGEWQLSMPISDEISEHDLAEVGIHIAKQQRQQAKAYLPPTESVYRPQWHISPPQGLLNDPNGFVYHQGEYYLFYQWHPFACQHKDKYWVLLKSQDLINWRWHSIALTPSDWFDSHGVFSGHAVSDGDDLWLFYTGNTRLGHDRQRQTMQCIAKANSEGGFTKLGPVIRTLPDGVTEHIRDPKVVYKQGRWQMLLGAQTQQLAGCLAVYHSDNLHDWQFDGLYGQELAPYGYMWECPDRFELDGQTLVVFGPQGIRSPNPHHTIEHHNRIFTVADNQQGQLQFLQGWELDCGFDFYAPQTALTPDGRRVLCGWMGLPDEVDHPSCADGWIHQLTALRELRWINGRVIQSPIRELTQLRGEKRSLHLTEQGIDIGGKSYELQLTLPWGCELHLMKNRYQQVVLSLDEQSHTLRLDRSHTEIRQGDTIREISLTTQRVNLHILVDHSSIEIFINQGEQVMSSRVFTAPDATQIALFGAEVEADYFPLQATLKPFAA